ncbi:MAG: spiro-SPASM protein [Spirochaetales bacterium]|jgi:spiro-SPASM protein|nr:spiro-SPASM protein [Spirochaetales bacterium]
MKNLVVINVGDGQCFSRRLGGRSVFERVLDYARRFGPGGDVVVAGFGDFPGEEGLRRVVFEGPTDRALVRALSDVSAGYDNIVYVWGDSPFLDGDLSLRMLENHVRYFAHYTFADGYPLGVAPEIVSVRTLPVLAALCREPFGVLGRETLFTLIQKDINAFDLETELSPKDMRLLRASLTADTRRNFLVCERLAALVPFAPEGGADSGEVLRVLEEKPEIMRTLPAYVGVQITGGCPQSCVFCPYPRMGASAGGEGGGAGTGTGTGAMPVERFERIVEKVEAFCGDAVIGVSLWGEPSFHGEFARLAECVAKRGNLSLLVETSGIGWSDEALRETVGLLGERVTFIVSLDAAEAGLYERLRGRGFEEALGRVRFFLDEFPERLYVQALRMMDNEESMESFYRAWKEKTPRLIIQKYDWFCGFLPQRKVTDLSPLSRFPCRHLQRDLSILMDGTVPLCREDITAGRVLGNIFSDSLETIWQRGGVAYREHLQKNYGGICGNCDEYYTYNF